jgi:methionyl-tRNA formyltransferase
LNKDIVYPYASGDLLENRNTYFYSDYLGERFIAAWRRQRAEAVASLEESEMSGQSDPQPELPTDRLLETLLRDFTSGKVSEQSRRLLDALLQRFEVTKRLHGEYNAGFRPTDLADYRKMERYVRFGEVLDAAYGETTSLPYLNALMKCLDTLTALHQRLDARQRKRVILLIGREEWYYERLASKLLGGKSAT